MLSEPPPELLLRYPRWPNGCSPWFLDNLGIAPLRVDSVVELRSSSSVQRLDTFLGPASPGETARIAVAGRVFLRFSRCTSSGGRSIGDISRHQRLRDNDQHDVAARDMLGELCQDNQRLVAFLLETHELCERFSDVATARLIEVWIDETEKRVWFLAETVSSS
jgi:hypothetical protein